METQNKFVVKTVWGNFTKVADPDKRTFGKLEVITYSQIQQILEQMNPPMKKVFGDYHWSIAPAPAPAVRGYEIIARSGSHRFVESTGRTPKEAFFNCFQVRAILGQKICG